MLYVGSAEKTRSRSKTVPTHRREGSGEVLLHQVAIDGLKAKPPSSDASSSSGASKKVTSPTSPTARAVEGFIMKGSLALKTELRGSAEVLLPAAQAGDAPAVFTVGVGEPLGEMPLFHSVPRSADAVGGADGGTLAICAFHEIEVLRTKQPEVRRQPSALHIPPLAAAHTPPPPLRRSSSCSSSSRAPARGGCSTTLHFARAPTRAPSPPSPPRTTRGSNANCR